MNTEQKERTNRASASVNTETKPPKLPKNNILKDEDTNPENITPDLAGELLKIDFEQAYVLHNHYKDSEFRLYTLSLKVLSLPLVLAAALMSAKLIATNEDLTDIWNIPFMAIAMLVSSCLNIVVVRSYIVTDKVQTESKHQVNRIRSLYLHAMASSFPRGWRPYWGDKNEYLNTKRKLKAALIAPLVLGAINGVYFGLGVGFLLNHSWGTFYATIAALCFGTAIFLCQQEFFWKLFKNFGK